MHTVQLVTENFTGLPADSEDLVQSALSTCLREAAVLSAGTSPNTRPKL